MNPQTGLSFEQAPPLSIPLRFFLTAPLFLLAAAGLIVAAPDVLASRWTPQALALTHALTLGFLAMVMIGALMQMLPVVAGSVIPMPRMVAWLTHLPLSIGTAALMAGFLGAGLPAMATGTVLLAIAFTLFLVAGGISLARAAGNITVTGIRLAVISLSVAAALGISLALVRTGMALPIEVTNSSASHISFGLLGWVLLLVIGVAYQVVPMFQITPPYPPMISRWLTGTLFVLLLSHIVTTLLPTITSLMVDAGIACGIILFSLATMRLQSLRRRKLPDITLNFWRVGMASLIACVAAWFAAQLWPAWQESNSYPILLGVLFIGGFAVSVVNGMLYKIVPFLAWFHLQAQLQAKAGTIPNMKQMIEDRRMRMQFYLHLAVCALLVAAVFQPSPFSALSGVAMGISALLLWLNLLSATWRFLRHGGRLT